MNPRRQKRTSPIDRLERRLAHLCVVAASIRLLVTATEVDAWSCALAITLLIITTPRDRLPDLLAAWRSVTALREHGNGAPGR